MFYFDSDRQEIRNWIQTALAATEQKFHDQVLALHQEIDELRQKNLALAKELETLKSKPAETKIATPARTAAKSIFHIDETTGVYFNNNRTDILNKAKRAANLNAITNFLNSNDSETAQKFQRLIDSHLKQVNKFIDKLNLDNIDDAELSENVTAKYFKLFFIVFFDNILVAINRGGSDFYNDFLKVVNEYLRSCGIYSVDVKAGVKVTDEDYQNMTPQVKNTADNNLNGVIAEVERLPYRINYLDEFGEQKYLQYNGIMTIYKAV